MCNVFGSPFGRKLFSGNFQQNIFLCSLITFKLKKSSPGEDFGWWSWCSNHSELLEFEISWNFTVEYTGLYSWDFLLSALQICQKQKDRKLHALCTIFNKSKSFLWATWFICSYFLSSHFTEAICFYWTWYKEPGVFCLSISDRSVISTKNLFHFDNNWTWDC